MTSEPHAVVETGITDRPLDVGAIVSRAYGPECGGIAVFVGTVRESPAVGGRNERVVRLEYDAHPTLASDKMQQVALRATEKWDVRRIVAYHRTGPCELGEPTVVIACAALHRSDALEACRWAIDEVKATVPIWKKEVYEGTDESAWVGADEGGRG